MNSDLDEQMTVAIEHIQKLTVLRNKVEKNKISNRSDVQHLRKQIATLKQDINFSKQEMEDAKEIYEKARDLYNKQDSQLKLFTSHLQLIIDNHKQEQEKHINNLLTAMKLSE